MTNEPSRCTSSTSRLVRAIDVTNKNKLWVNGLSVFGLNSGFICVLLVMSSITLPIASAIEDELCAKHQSRQYRHLAFSLACHLTGFWSLSFKNPLISSRICDMLSFGRARTIWDLSPYWGDNGNTELANCLHNGHRYSPLHSNNGKKIRANSNESSLINRTFREREFVAVVAISRMSGTNLNSLNANGVRKFERERHHPIPYSLTGTRISIFEQCV